MTMQSKKRRVSKAVAIFSSAALLLTVPCVNVSSGDMTVGAETDISSVWGATDEYVDAKDVFVTTPELNKEGDKVVFSVTNHTKESKNLVIDVKDYDGDKVAGEDEYNLEVKSGICDQEISLPADKGDLLNIADKDGNSYFKDVKLGTYSWVSTWATAEEKNNINKDNMPKLDMKGTTFRQVFMVTTSGTKFRFKFSNQYGEGPVEMKSVHVAKQVTPGDPEIDVTTDTVVTFNGGSQSVSIPKGKTVVSDPIEFRANACDKLAISTFFGSVPKTITGHRGGRATMFQEAGNKVSNKTISDKNNCTCWAYLCDCAVESPEGSKAVVCFGDSITDGYGTDATYLNHKPDSYIRWGDFFTYRLQKEGKEKISVLNEGIGANGMFGAYPTDPGKDRFARDLLEHDGVAYCIILFGVNDMNQLRDTKTADRLIAEYKKMVDLCHKNGIKVYAAPVLPFGTSSYYSEKSEETRQIVNNWMRSAEAGYDGVIDFESAVIDPATAGTAKPSVLKKYTGSDGLHPYDGYEAMANAIDLNLF